MTKIVLFRRVRQAEAERDHLVSVLREWREADADESGTLQASLRRDAAFVSMIDTIDALTTEEPANERS